ncbi:hypothetical protein JXO52_14035 [bacterium]|nr:hypothetical protein [bacterium]
MVGDSGFYTCIHKRNHISDCTNSNISSDYIDKKVISFVKEILLTEGHFVRVIEETKRLYQKEMKKSKDDTARLKRQIADIDEQVDRLMSLFERGQISPEIIESRISSLERQREEIENIFTGERHIQTMIKHAESELSETTIKAYIDRFEDLLGTHNLELMRDFVKTFVSKIELCGRVKGKKRGRDVTIHGQIPALTRIAVASPRGIEPLLQE